MTILAYAAHEDISGLLCDSPTPIAVDPAHLFVAFTAPPSGRVLVRLTANVSVEPTFDVNFGLLEKGALVSPMRHVAGGRDSWHVGVVSVALVVRNLVPGSAHNYQWAYSTNAEANFRVEAAYGFPPAVMEVHKLP